MKASKPNQIEIASRSGIAAVEAALCVPVVALLVFGSIEASNAIFLKQAITVAAYESAQIASANGGTEAAAIQRGNEVLATYNVSGATISVSPSITPAVTRGTRITVTVSLPAEANIAGPSLFFMNTNLTRDFSMNRL